MSDKSEFYINKAILKHGIKYNYSLVKNVKKRIDIVTIICPEHGQFTQSLHKHICGDGCKKCGSILTGNKISEIARNNFIEKANKIHNNFYDYSKVNYINAKTDIIIICPDHGEYTKKPTQHLNGYKCRKCTNISLIISWKTMLKYFNEIHKNKYNYSKVINYNGVDSKITVICPEHGEFLISAQEHKTRGCKICKKIVKKENKNNEDIQKEFLLRSISIWGNLYDYSKVNYINSESKVIIICKKHGEFEQLPHNHYKYQCRVCSAENNKRNLELKYKASCSFRERANKVHNNKYNYEKSVYINSIIKLTVICPDHGEFKIAPNNHLRGKGCAKCFSNYSRISIQWLNYLQLKYNLFIQNADNIGEYRVPKTHFKADGYCKENNTIYEFHGDFWHGNPEIYDLLEINYVNNKTYLELFERTNNKREILLKLGYNYVEIWENNWNKFINIVINLQRIFKYYH
jgi:hypothetical protein